MNIHSINTIHAAKFIELNPVLMHLDLLIVVCYSVQNYFILLFVLLIRFYKNQQLITVHKISFFCFITYLYV